ncbi:hypothetical protein [Methylobacterium oryzihabitans]|uniref:Uncharacterized protein n=1 Tax=Methylobacterium oryzihabitans TaxID=2499852 RepID=A0A437P253_9HYPH|nr:hypothetical protein [Methylobacterium oryzihabitans]RVU16332.1 hypothetical protein EOE48_16705 [Methylobacterium oryzihabitans]
MFHDGHPVRAQCSRSRMHHSARPRIREDQARMRQDKAKLNRGRIEDTTEINVLPTPASAAGAAP